LKEIVVAGEPRALRIVHESPGTRVVALTCEGDHAWLLVSESGRLALQRVTP
jgi:hypothetical protein